MSKIKHRPIHYYLLQAAAILASMVLSLPARGEFTPLSDSDATAKAMELVSKMTLDEKLSMIHGQGFNMAAIERLGIPAINMSDASMGLRVSQWPKCKGLEPSTAFPASLLLTATWDRNQAYRYAHAVAEEFRARNIHILLGPAINIYRNPLCGRNFEYTGEDPYLTASMVVPYVKAVTDIRVLPVVKHFVANNSDNRRKVSSSEVSERALREIYFPGFKAAVKQGHTPAIMNAYNLLNGVYCGENKWLLKDVLRKEWGFNGMVISDWSSIWNSELAAKSGVDIEMPGGKQSTAISPDNMKKLLKDGKITEQEIDSKVIHLIAPCLKYGLYEKDWQRPELNKLQEHAETALQTARKGITLLKNKAGALPVLPETVTNIVVLGPAAASTPTTGSGSGGVRPDEPVSIWDGIQRFYGDKAELLADFDSNKVARADAVIVCCGLNSGLKLGDLRKNKKKAPPDPGLPKFTKNQTGPIEGEGTDRGNFGLPQYQNNLIKKCAETNQRTILLLTAGAAVDMRPWVDKVPGIMWLYYPGQNGALAAVEIVAGKTNPSGHLPFTYDRRLEDNAAFHDLGLSWSDKRKWHTAGIRSYQRVEYSEGIFLGYRHYDKAGIKPLFPFGHGLSYTTFNYSNLEIKPAQADSIEVSFLVKNSGKRHGAAVPQVYVGDQDCSIPRPVKELKGFERLSLDPGKEKTVHIILDRSAFAFWSPATKHWTLEPGKFTIYIGESAGDIRLSKQIEYPVGNN